MSELKALLMTNNHLKHVSSIGILALIQMHADVPHREGILHTSVGPWHK